MNPKETLTNIIKHGGNCSGWSNRKVCDACPLARWKKTDAGRFKNCVEAVEIQDIADEAAADAKYLEAAKRRLIDIEIEETLDGTEQ